MKVIMENDSHWITYKAPRSLINATKNIKMHHHQRICDMKSLLTKDKKPNLTNIYN